MCKSGSFLCMCLSRGGTDVQEKMLYLVHLHGHQCGALSKHIWPNLQHSGQGAGQPQMDSRGCHVGNTGQKDSSGDRFTNRISIMLVSLLVTRALPMQEDPAAPPPQHRAGPRVPLASGEWLPWLQPERQQATLTCPSGGKGKTFFPSALPPHLPLLFHQEILPPTCLFHDVVKTAGSILASPQLHPGEVEA